MTEVRTPDSPARHGGNESHGVLFIETDGPVARVVLNRPYALNALSNELKDALAEAMEQLARDDAVHVVILKGQGRAFCAGADQKENATFDASAAAARMDKWDRLYRAIRDMPQPVIVAIQGYAAGGGLQIALLGDLRIAAEDAKLGMTELNVGSPCITGSAILRPIVGSATATWMVLTGEFVSGDEARRLNLVHEVVPADQLARRADELAGQLAEKHSTAMTLTKRWLRELGDPLFAYMSLRSRALHEESFAAGDFTAGAERFIAERAHG